MHQTESVTRSVRAWDLPTRLFHGLLAVAVAAAVVTAKVGGDWIEWHFRLGYLICTLLAFRLLWGLFGGRWSRFTSFVHAPTTIWRYLRGQPHPAEPLDVGHNPLGGLSVLAMLGWLLLQVSTGMVADDEIASTGPLAAFVSSDSSLAATSWHRSVGQWVLLALIGLHLAAITWYRIGRGHDLVRPMLTGDKLLVAPVPASEDSLATRLRALLVLALCAAIVAYLVSLGN